MSVVNPIDARDHLRLDLDFPDEELRRKLAAAEEAASDFMGRSIFVDQDALTAAAAEATATLAAASAAYAAAKASALTISDLTTACDVLDVAFLAYADSRSAALKNLNGIVVTPVVESAILLILGHLFENKQNVIASDGRAAAIELPQGAYHLLAPKRINMGV